MTEKEAWLELAEMFGSDRPLPQIRGTDDNFATTVDGICWGIEYLTQQGNINLDTDEAMDDRLYSFFLPERSVAGYFWPRGLRQLRAMACCFLAAMCDD